ncbi:helix-turn-helix domain-containing protein [Chryseobacterium sp. TY4]
MSVQLYSHSKSDLEKAVEIILQKANNLLLMKEKKETSSREDDLISQNDAAEFLKISIPTIIEWRKNKDLPHYDFNGRYFYSKEELLQYGRNRRNK